MSDTIYRQRAIDELCDNCDNAKAVCAHYPCKQYIAIEQLPSAHPESTMGQPTELSQSTKDCISRQAAIDAVSKACEECRGIFARCKENLLSLPSAEPEQRWIPMTERHPLDKGQYYLCSFHKSNDVGRLFWTGGSWYGYAADEISAWMPMPTPWKGEEDEWTEDD